MADVTGPISTLAGAFHKVPSGVMCDDHPERPATHRVQGETDSFGSELHDMCDECHARHKTAMAQYREEARIGCCDWCKRHATDLRDRRDFEEGSCGPVYRVCGACVKRQNDELEAELESSGYYDNQYDGGDFDPADDDWYDPHADADADDGSDDFHPSDAEVDVETVKREQQVIQMMDDRPAGHPRAYIDGQFIF